MVGFSQSGFQGLSRFLQEGLNWLWLRQCTNGTGGHSGRFTVRVKEALPWFLSTLKHDHEVLILNKEEESFQKSVQNVLKWCFYVATPTCSLSIPGLQVGAEPAEVSHTHTCCCMVKRGGAGINDVIITVYFDWAFWLSGFQLSERNQKYTGKTYLHIITTPGGLLE